MSEPQDRKLATCLADHPRLMGALFTIMVLLTKAGSVAASHAGACDGP